MPTTGELADQNIRDRYYGINDPVARKMMRRLGERVALDPPEDAEIKTLYIGNVEPDWKEDDLREPFEKHGTVAAIRIVHSKSCAFVTFETREEAERAADKLHDALIVRGTRCKLLWGKPQAERTGQPGLPAPYAPGGVLAGPPGSAPGAPQGPEYPSMDPSLMGSAAGGGGGGAPPPLPQGGPQMRPPPGMMRPPPMFFGPMPGMMAPPPGMYAPAMGPPPGRPPPIAPGRAPPGPRPPPMAAPAGGAPSTAGGTTATPAAGATAAAQT